MPPSREYFKACNISLAVFVEYFAVIYRYFFIWQRSWMFTFMSSYKVWSASCEGVGLGMEQICGLLLYM